MFCCEELKAVQPSQLASANYCLSITFHKNISKKWRKKKISQDGYVFMRRMIRKLGFNVQSPQRKIDVRAECKKQIKLKSETIKVQYKGRIKVQLNACLLKQLLFVYESCMTKIAGNDWMVYECNNMLAKCSIISLRRLLDSWWLRMCLNSSACK